MLIVFALLSTLLSVPSIFAAAAAEEVPNRLIKGVRISDDRYQHIRHHLGQPTGDESLYNIIHKGVCFPGASIPESLEGAYSVLRKINEKGRAQNNQWKKVKARAGMGQILGRRGFIHSKHETSDFLVRVQGRLQSVWAGRQGPYSIDTLVTAHGADRAKAKKTLYSVGMWLAAIKVDLFERGFQTPDTSDFQGAWDILSQISEEKWSKSKVVFAFKASLLASSIGTPFNPFDTDDERLQAMEDYLDSYLHVSHQHTASHGQRGVRCSRDYGHVRSKTTFTDRAGRSLIERVQAALQAAGNIDDGHESPDEHTGSVGHNGYDSDDEGGDDEGDDGALDLGDGPHLDVLHTDTVNTTDVDMTPPNESLFNTASDVIMMPVAEGPLHEAAEEESSDGEIWPSRVGNRKRVVNRLESSEDEEEKEETMRPTAEAPSVYETHARADGEVRVMPTGKRAKRRIAHEDISDEDEEEDETMSMAGLAHPKKIKGSKKNECRNAKIISLRHAGYSLREIAQRLNTEYPQLSFSSVGSILKNNGLGTGVKRANILTAAQKEQVITLYQTMLTADEVPVYGTIAEQVGCSYRQVERAINAYRERTGKVKKRRTKAELEMLREGIINAYLLQQQEVRAGTRKKPDIKEIAGQFAVSKSYVSSKVITPAVKSGRILHTTESRLSKAQTAELKGMIVSRGIHKNGKSEEANQAIADTFNAAHFEGKPIVMEWRVDKLRIELKKDKA